MDPRTPDRVDIFGETRERLAAAVVGVLRDVIPELADDLEVQGERCLSRRDRQSIFATAALLRIEQAIRAERAGRCLTERALRCLELAQQPDADVEAPRLLAREDHDAQIELADIAVAVRERVGVRYDEYSRRVANLSAQTWANDDLSPLGARTLAFAACVAMAGVADTEAARNAVRTALRLRLPAPLARAIVDTDEQLAERKVVALLAPEIAAVQERAARGVERATAVPQPPAPAPASAAPAATPHDTHAEPLHAGAPAAAPLPADAGPATLVDQALHSARTLGTSPLADPRADRPQVVLPALQPVADIERDAVAFAHSIDVVPYSRDARQAFFRNVRARVHAAGGSATQASVIDLVAAMFDYVVDDRRIPEAAKSLVWRLQQPAVALSLLDPGYLGDDPRSLRRLVENFGAIAMAFGGELVRGNELHRRLETVVRAVEIVAGVLQTRSAVLSRQVEHEYQRAAHNVSQLIERVVTERNTLEATPARRNRRDYGRRPDKRREDEVTQRLVALLSERLARHDVPDSVREFVLNVWLRHLRTAVLRDGEDSTEYRVALQVVDDLLWSLDSGGERHSRRELAQKIPPLIRLLTTGLRQIGARDEEYKPFFDELFLIHLRKMQRRRDDASREAGREAARAPKPEDHAAAAAGESAVPVLDEAIVAAGVQPIGGESGEAARVAHAVQPSGAPAAPAAAEPDTAPQPAEETGGQVPVESLAPAPERRLLEVLHSIDLNDFPANPRARNLDVDAALEAIRRGDWLELETREGEVGYAKVAWINSRRTVVLLVKRADRKALSLRLSELRTRFLQGRARLLVS